MGVEVLERIAGTTKTHRVRCRVCGGVYVTEGWRTNIEQRRKSCGDCSHKMRTPESYVRIANRGLSSVEKPRRRHRRRVPG